MRGVGLGDYSPYSASTEKRVLNTSLKLGPVYYTAEDRPSVARRIGKP